MSIQRIKLALNNAQVPLVSAQAARSVIIPGADVSSRTPRLFLGSEATIDYNLPQLIYGENIMPSNEGINSVGYTQLIPPSASFTDFDTVFPLRDEHENVVLFSPAKGRNYIHTVSTNTWAASPTIPAIWGLTLAAGLNVANSRVTYAYVDGRTFVCYSRLRSNQTPTATDMSILVWNATTRTLQPSTTLVTNLPFPPGEIDGIASSSGHLIVWSGLNIAWAPFNGTAFNFLPFANGAFTGAGRQIPEDVKGTITSILSIAGGFVAFTRRNAVAANYHAESVGSPWVFREVPNAGGLESYEQATVEGSFSKLYAYTSSGLQALSLNSAESLHPEVADFIAGRQVDRFDSATGQVIPVVVPIDLYIKVTNIGNRYLVISYGTFLGVYSYALVFDTQLKRWGKLRIVHTDCFNYVYAAPAQQITYGMLQDVDYNATNNRTYATMTATDTGLTAAQHAIAFITNTGAVFVATWATRTTATPDAAIAVIGRLQLTRTSHTQVNRVELEGLSNGTVDIQASDDGYNIARVAPTVPVVQTPNMRIVGCLVDCKNFNLLIRGSFNLRTVIVEAITSGRI